MSQGGQRAYLNLLEPPQFLRLFGRYPPLGFSCRPDSLEQPVFSLDFDLLTTLEPKALRILKKLPCFRYWSRILKFETCFLGSTNTEYAPLAADLGAEELIGRIMAEHGRGQPLLIIKDLPAASPFLGERENSLAEALCRAAGRRRLIEVQGQALAYVPIDFASIEEYLGRFSAARRRDLRRKLKKRELLEIQTLQLGDPLFFREEFLDQLYAMYRAVYEQSEIHFDLLSREYLAALLQSGDIEGVVVMYRAENAQGQRELVGYNLCLVQQGRLLDKYIGLKYPRARELNLYFVSWLVNLEWALENGLETYIAGWTDPEVKRSLGASFTFTRHLVWVRNPLLRRLLYIFRRLFEADRNTLEKAS